MEKFPKASQRRVCRLLVVHRSTVWRQAQRSCAHTNPVVDEVLAGRIKSIIEEFPTYGYRRVWAILRFRDKILVNKKKVYRILRLNHWLTRYRKHTPRPRVSQWVSQVDGSNQRWAVDITHVACGADGWGHLVAVIDCFDRQIVGYEFALRGRAVEAERALEEACLNRFGLVYPKDQENRLMLRSDNGLVFQSRRFRASSRQYGLSQEFITPYTPQQNGLIEGFFRSLKEECVWLDNFRSFVEARTAINEWIRYYNEDRPHQALGYRSPCQVAPQQMMAA